MVVEHTYRNRKKLRGWTRSGEAGSEAPRAPKTPEQEKMGPVQSKPVGTLPTIKYREPVANDRRNGCHGQ
jgi:hypothetical protein